MQEKLKEPRVYMCIAFFLTLILPWMKVESKTEGVDAMGVAMNGFDVFFHSIFGILLVLVLVALLVLELAPQFQMKMSIFYLAGAALGIILTIVLCFTAKGGAAMGAEAGAEIAESAGVKTDSSSSMQIGFWLQMAIYLAIIAFTLIKDFAVNKDALREQGIKGVFTNVAGSVTKDFTETAGKINVPNGISDMVSVPCPNCGAGVMKGKKFCNKCGQRMPGAQSRVDSSQKPLTASESADKAASVPVSKTLTAAKAVRHEKLQSAAAAGQAAAGMITVREYIAGLQEVPCENCGERIPSGIKFCPNCGEAVVVKIMPKQCERCGGAIPEGKKFCPDCGQEVKPKELQTNCKKCNAELIFGKKFCVECGAKVENL